MVVSLSQALPKRLKNGSEKENKNMQKQVIDNDTDLLFLRDIFKHFQYTVVKTQSSITF